MQNADGSVSVSSTTAFGATGVAGNIETTVFAVMTWQNNAGAYSAQISNGLNYIASQFGSQMFVFPFSAISAVNLLTTYLAPYSGLNGNGVFDLNINGVDLSQTAFSQNNQGIVQVTPSSNAQL